MSSARPRFTVLDRADAEAACAEFGVGALIDLSPIAAGTINSNYRLSAEAGRFFLRVNEGKAEQDVQYEAELVVELARAGVSTPPPRPARTGRRYATIGGRLFSLFDWVDGIHREASEVTAGDAEQVGGALAQLHLAGITLAARFARDGIYTFAEIVRRLDSFRDSSDPQLRPAIELCAQETEWLVARKSDRLAATGGIIHGDLFRDNVLFDGERIAALIDFEQASLGSLAYDLAVAINAWCYDGELDLAMASAMVRGYSKRRPLSVADASAIPIELRAAAMRFTVTRITDVYLAGVSRAGKDFRRYVDRLRRWRALSEDEIRRALCI
jgi:homoserine kinase type II